METREFGLWAPVGAPSALAAAGRTEASRGGRLWHFSISSSASVTGGSCGLEGRAVGSWGAGDRSYPSAELVLASACVTSLKPF